MATGRILKAQISCSEQVNDLSIKAAFLFTWLIPHVDDFGRIWGSARKIKAIVLPMREDFSAKDIEKCLFEMEQKGLVLLYKIDDECFLQLKKFDTHQTGLHKRTTSKFPDPIEQEKTYIPGSSGKSPPEEKRRELEEKQNNNITSCSELKNCTALVLNTGEEYFFEQVRVEEWKSLYPAVDVEQEIRNMRGWCQANPSNRKTRKGVEKFANGWLAREQNKPRGGGARPGGVVDFSVQRQQQNTENLRKLGLLPAENEHEQR